MELSFTYEVATYQRSLKYAKSRLSKILIHRVLQKSNIDIPIPIPNPFHHFNIRCLLTPPRIYFNSNGQNMRKTETLSTQKGFLDSVLLLYNPLLHIHASTICEVRRIKKPVNKPWYALTTAAAPVNGVRVLVGVEWLIVPVAVALLVMLDIYC